MAEIFFNVTKIPFVQFYMITKSISKQEFHTGSHSRPFIRPCYVELLVSQTNA